MPEVGEAVEVVRKQAEALLEQKSLELFNRKLQESRLAEQALRESEQRYQLLVEQSPEAILIEVDGRFVYAASAVDHALDYGDYPARVGECSYFVTYATTKNASTGYPVSVSVRTFDV